MNVTQTRSQIKAHVTFINDNISVILYIHLYENADMHSNNADVTWQYMALSPLWVDPTIDGRAENEAAILRG